MRLFGHDHNALVDWLAADWLASGPQVAAIVGPSGVGKSEVATALLRRLPPARGILLKVPEVEGNPFDEFVDELRICLAGLGIVPRQQDGSPDYTVSAVVRAWHDLLASPNESFVVVFDEFQHALDPEGNLRNGFATLITPIQPHAPSRLLLVGNRKLHTHECDHVERRELTGLKEAGREMFDAVLAAEGRDREVPPDRRDDLVRWVDGNPRALRLIAHSLDAAALDDLIRERPELWQTDERYVESHLLGEIEKVLFQKAFSNQPPEARELLLDLAVHRRGFDRKAAEVVWGKKPGYVLDTLRLLANRYLITHRQGWYGLSDVARDVCRHRHLTVGKKQQAYKKAHAAAAEYYARRMQRHPPTQADRSGPDFCEARFHYTQAGRPKDLRPLALRYAEHLKAVCGHGAKVPNDPERLEERIVTVRAVLDGGEEHNKLLTVHLARCLDARGRPGDKAAATAMLREYEDDLRRWQMRLPQHEDYWLFRVRIEESGAGTDAAVAVATWAFDNIPAEFLTSVYLFISDCFRRDSRAPDAVALIRRGIERTSPGADLQILSKRLADHLQGLGRGDEAIGVLKAGIHDTPEECRTHDLYLPLADLLGAADQGDEAISVLEAAIRDAPTRRRCPLYLKLAELLGAAGRGDEAIGVLQAAIRDTPKDSRTDDLYLRLAQLLEAAGRGDEVIGVLEAGIRDLPGMSSTRLALKLAGGATKQSAFWRRPSATPRRGAGRTP